MSKERNKADDYREKAQPSILREVRRSLLKQAQASTTKNVLSELTHTVLDKFDMYCHNSNYIFKKSIIISTKLFNISLLSRMIFFRKASYTIITAKQIVLLFKMIQIIEEICKVFPIFLAFLPQFMMLLI